MLAKNPGTGKMVRSAKVFDFPMVEIAQNI